MNFVVQKTDFPDLRLHARGKVRDMYDAGENLLFVATDRISAFDHVLATGIPKKGFVLTQLSLFWFDFLKDLVDNHVVIAKVEEFPPPLRVYADQLRGRALIVCRAEMVPIECVVRGYISGSGWKEYRQRGKVCGIELPKGLRESEKLPGPIFTPATKSVSGEHDENIPFSEMVKRAGPDTSAKLRELSVKIYKKAAQYAEGRGIIIADTKFEFGRSARGMVLADEVLTPDSSRFWSAETYKPGSSQPSYDKQYVRDYLESIHWDKKPPAPSLPKEIAEKTSEKYVQAFRQLTGKELVV